MNLFSPCVNEIIEERARIAESKPVKANSEVKLKRAEVRRRIEEINETKIEKQELLINIERLESEKHVLEHQLSNAIIEINRLKGENR